MRDERLLQSETGRLQPETQGATWENRSPATSDNINT